VSCPSRPRTPAARDRRGRSPCAIVASRTHLVRRLLGIFFSAVQEAFYRPAERRFAHSHPHRGGEELDPLGMGSPWPFFEVLCKKSHRFLDELWGLAGSLARFEGAALIEPFAVACSSA
jgi:hypothetical protein